MNNRELVELVLSQGRQIENLQIRVVGLDSELANRTWMNYPGGLWKQDRMVWIGTVVELILEYLSLKLVPGGPSLVWIEKVKRDAPTD